MPRSRVSMWILRACFSSTWCLSHVILFQTLCLHRSKLQFFLGFITPLFPYKLSGVGFRMLKGSQQRRKAIMIAMRIILVVIKIYLPSGIQMTRSTNKKTILKETQILIWFLISPRACESIRNKDFSSYGVTWMDRIPMEILVLRKEDVYSLTLLAQEKLFWSSVFCTAIWRSDFNPFSWWILGVCLLEEHTIKYAYNHASA